MRDNPMLTLEMRRWRLGRAGLIKMLMPSALLSLVSVLNLMWGLTERTHPSSRSEWLEVQFPLALAVYLFLTLWTILTLVTEGSSKRTLFQETMLTPGEPSRLIDGLAIALGLRVLPGLLVYVLCALAVTHQRGFGSLSGNLPLLMLFLWICLAQVMVISVWLQTPRLEPVALPRALLSGLLILSLDVMGLGLLIKSIGLVVLLTGGGQHVPLFSSTRLTPPGER